VIAPNTYVLSAEAARGMDRYVRNGGCLVVSYLSGVVGSTCTVGLGGYPASLRSLLGVSVEEFHPLAQDELVPLSGGGYGSVWSERLAAHDADVLDRYEAGDLTDSPALTRRAAGSGYAWYVSTRLCEERNDLLVRDVLATAGLAPALPKVAPEVHGLVRHDGAGRAWQFWLNYGSTPVEVPARGYDLLDHRAVTGNIDLPPGAAAVVRQDGPP
jgi:beta-galactosidase